METVYYNTKFNCYSTQSMELIPSIEEYIKTSLESNTVIQIYKVPEIPKDSNGI